MRSLLYIITSILSKNLILLNKIAMISYNKACIFVYFRELFFRQRSHLAQ